MRRTCAVKRTLADAMLEDTSSDSSGDKLEPSFSEEGSNAEPEEEANMLETIQDDNFRMENVENEDDDTILSPPTSPMPGPAPNASRSPLTTGN